MQYSQEGETLLQKNIREWKERILLESREKGLLEGRREGRRKRVGWKGNERWCATLQPGSSGR